MRGKGSLLQGDASPLGITPAYAGKSTFVTGSVSAQKDHPRICGEKRYAFSDMICPVGSPPRMRGKEAQHFAGAAAPGITPAYAGKRASVRFISLSPWDHPRVCGEKSTFVPHEVCNVGSPPRMRGKETETADNPCYHGITPAYAGKSLQAIFSRRCHRDHPRVCGEKSRYGLSFSGK